MAKRFKFRISKVITYFQSCRSKDPSTLPENPIPAIFRLSPVNPKALDIDFPATTVFQDPPPLKSRNSSLKHHVSSAIVSVGCGCRSRSGRKYINSDDDNESADYKWNKEEKWHVVARVNEDTPRRKIYNSSVSGDSDSDVSPPPPPTTEKKKKQKNKKKAKSKVRISTSSADSGWFSSEGNDENDDEETETLVSSRSFSTDSSWDFNPHLETIRETPINRSRRKKKNQKKVKKVKSHASKMKKRYPSPENESPARLSVFRRLIPCTVDGKVRESFAVVKKSEDPYEDFKRSMLEMIFEKHMFEAKDLEELLQCFLSLNSRHHHEVIVLAFSEIWEALFSKSPTQLVPKAL